MDNRRTIMNNYIKMSLLCIAELLYTSQTISTWNTMYSNFRNRINSYLYSPRQREYYVVPRSLREIEQEELAARKRLRDVMIGDPLMEAITCETYDYETGNRGGYPRPISQKWVVIPGSWERDKKWSI